MWNHTDLPELNARIIYFVERAVWAAHRDAFDENNIKRDDVILFEVPYASCDIEGNRISKALYTLVNRELIDRFERFIIWDCDLFACRPNESSAKHYFSDSEYFSTNSKSTNGMALMHWWSDPNKQKQSDYTDFHWWWNKWNIGVKAGFNHGLPRMQSLVPNHDFSKGCTIQIQGGIKYFVPKLISQEFIQFALKAEPLLGDEENVFHLWHYKSGAQYMNILEEWRRNNISMCWNLSEVKRAAKGDKCYFTHLLDPADGNKTWEQLWQQQVVI